MLTMCQRGKIKIIPIFGIEMSRAVVAFMQEYNIMIPVCKFPIHIKGSIKVITNFKREGQAFTK